MNEALLRLILPYIINTGVSQKAGRRRLTWEHQILLLYQFQKYILCSLL